MLRYPVTVTSCSINLSVQWWCCGLVAVHSCPVHQETVGTVEETCDWALTVTSRSLWTTSSQPWCRLFPLHWQRGPSTVERQVLRTWRPMSPTETRSWLVWRWYVTTTRRSLNNTDTDMSELLYNMPDTTMVQQRKTPIQESNMDCSALGNVIVRDRSQYKNSMITSPFCLKPNWKGKEQKQYTSFKQLRQTCSDSDTSIIMSKEG